MFTVRALKRRTCAAGPKDRSVGARSPVSAQREEFRLQRRRVRHLFHVTVVAALTPLVFGFLGAVAGLPQRFRLQVGIGRAVRMSQARYVLVSAERTETQ